MPRAYVLGAVLLCARPSRGECSGVPGTRKQAPSQRETGDATLGTTRCEATRQHSAPVTQLHVFGDKSRIRVD